MTGDERVAFRRTRQSYRRRACGSGLGKHNGKDALCCQLRRSSNTNWARALWCYPGGRQAGAPAPQPGRTWPYEFKQKLRRSIADGRELPRWVRLRKFGEPCTNSNRTFSDLAHVYASIAARRKRVLSRLGAGLARAWICAVSWDHPATRYAACGTASPTIAPWVPAVCLRAHLPSLPVATGARVDADQSRSGRPGPCA